MLSKLLKYDFKSIKRFGLPTVIVLAVLTVFTGAGVFGYVKLVDKLVTDNNENAAALMGIGGVFLLIALITVIYAAIIGVYVVIMVDFYKFTATDEAYLTFTLPVKPSQIIWSKLINAYGWGLVIIILVFAVVVSGVLGAALGVASISDYDAEPLDEIIDEVSYTLDASQLFGSMLSGILMIIQFLVSLAYGLIMYFFAIFLGSVIAKKYKVLAAIGCIFVISTINGVVLSMGQMILTIIAGGIAAGADNYMLFQNIILGAQTVFYVGMSVLLFCLLKNMMEKKLNLP